MAIDTIYLKETKTIHGDGVQKLYAFPNGYGASVVKHSGSYGGPQGKWEVAVLDGDGELCYNTNVTEDVIGNLNDPEVDSILLQISKLTDSDVYCEWNCGDTVEDCTGYKCWER
ncbi:hypothetical protein N9J02_01635 [bacterium]|nr:hypothetical protein [bacterium]